MKNIFLASFILASSLSVDAYVGRRVEYRCEGKGGSFAVVSDTEKRELNIVGQVRGKDVDFWSKGKRNGDVTTYADNASGIVVEVQRAGPYDGGQDALWGSASDGNSKQINMTCFIGMGDDVF